MNFIGSDHALGDFDFFLYDASKSNIQKISIDADYSITDISFVISNPDIIDISISNFLESVAAGTTYVSADIDISDNSIVGFSLDKQTSMFLGNTYK